jgi:tight adherence protein B
VFLTSKRSGVNLVEVVRNAANIINDKIEIQQDIDTILSQRKFEQKILNAIPLIIILFLYTTSPDYIEPVYSTLQGRVTMIAVLIMLSVSFAISKKIAEIKV